MHLLNNNRTLVTGGFRRCMVKQPNIQKCPIRTSRPSLALPLRLDLNLSPCPQASSIEPNFKSIRQRGAKLDIKDEFKKYDVFISHRGFDTKKGFVSFLYDRLVDAGLQPFLDQKSIHEGEECWRSVEHAIKTTPIAIVIFSENFANSNWCLQELHILLENPSIKVLPIFYNVQPSDLRYPEKGRLATGFEKLKSRCNNKNIEQLWREDLQRAANLKGWVYSNTEMRLEGDLVMEVVEYIFKLANKPLPLDVGQYVFGVEQVVNEIIQTIDQKKVLMLGLWGMGGIGKSTLARELYNRLNKRFASSCYIEDVRKKVNQVGVENIQRYILKDLCKIEESQIHSKSKGKIILEERLREKKILLVLDDVYDDAEMLEYMLSRKMLREGSMCIVTSRSKRVFEESISFQDHVHDIHVHKVNELNKEDSKKMFMSYAFGGGCKVKQGFEILVNDISRKCGGVPLVLKVFGALLKKKRDIRSWKDVLVKMNWNSAMDETSIFKCLQISYDDLSPKQQGMFLDIACALLGQSKDMAEHTWKSHGWSTILGVDELVSKALISVDDNGYFVMHDHLRDFGHNIEMKNENRKRMWITFDSSFSLENNEPLPDSLQTLTITKVDCMTKVNLDLSKMKELRILICDDVVNLTSIPTNLRWLKVNQKQFRKMVSIIIFPRVPKNNQLVVLDINCRPSHQACREIEHLTRLKVMHWNMGCLYAHELPNFGKLHLLQDIFIQGSVAQYCPKLDDLIFLEKFRLRHSKFQELPNLQNLKHLKVLDISYCRRLKVVPGLGDLEALEVFWAEGCDNLELLPNLKKLTKLHDLNLQYSPLIKTIPGLNYLISLRKIVANYNALEVHCYLRYLSKLKGWSSHGVIIGVLNLENLEDLTIQWSKSVKVLTGLFNLRRLQRLYLFESNFKDVSCLSNLTSLKSLWILNCRQIEILPTIHRLIKLETLIIRDCINLREWDGISELRMVETLGTYQSKVETLMQLKILHFDRLAITKLPDLSLFPQLEELELTSCEDLERLTSVEPMTMLRRLTVTGCKRLKELPNLTHSKLLRHLDVSGSGITLNDCEVRNLEVHCPGIQIIQHRCDEYNIDVVNIFNS